MTDELWDIAVSGNLNQVLADIRARLTALENRSLITAELSEITPEAGELSSGVDEDGPELADPGWSASTSGLTLTVYTTDRVAVNEGALMDFRVDMTPANRVAMPNASGVRSYVRVAWYDALSGGSEISRDNLAYWQGVTFRRTLMVPVGAVAMAFVCGLSAIGTTANTVNNFSAREIVRARRLKLDPTPSIQIEDIWQRIAAGTCGFPSPADKMPGVVRVVASTGNMAYGTYRYKVTFLDEFGETLPSSASVPVTTDSSYKQVIVQAALPIPKWAMGWRVYRTMVGGAESDPYYLVATVKPNLTTYQDNIADANLGPLAPEENTTLGRPVFPTSFAVTADRMLSSASVSRTANATQLHGEYWTVASNLYSWMAAGGLLMEPGRWEGYLTGVSANNRGIISVFLDGNLVDVQDWYSASTTLNVRKTFSVIVEEPGWHEVTLVVSGLNPSTSDGTIGLTELGLRRVGR